MEAQGWSIADYPANTVDWVLINFRTDPSSSSSILTKAGVLVMYAADVDQTLSTGYEVTGAEKILFEIANGNFNTYHPIDFNLNGDVNSDNKLTWFFNNGIFSGVEK